MLLRALQPYQLYDTQYSMCPTTMNAQDPKGGMNAQQRQKCDRIFQDAALLNKYSDGAALTDKEKKRVPRLQKNAQQRKHRRKDTALLN